LRNENFEVVEVNFMGLFGKSKKEREKEYMSRIDVPSCLKENFTLTVDEIFTIIGVGTVVTGNVETGICRTGEFEVTKRNCKWRRV
jgi:hypothetical protein